MALPSVLSKPVFEALLICFSVFFRWRWEPQEGWLGSRILHPPTHTLKHTPLTFYMCVYMCVLLARVHHIHMPGT